MVAAVGIAASLAGWLAVYVWALSGPKLGSQRASRRRLGGQRAGSQRVVNQGGSAARVPAAIVALMAGLRDADQFTVTMLDLGTRGWFRLTRSGARAVCVIPAEAPVEELNPYERTAVHHLAKRAGTHPRIPADAVADGFDGGESQFLAAFRKSVIEQARARGLTRPTLSLRRKLLLCLLALIPAAAPLLTEIGRRPNGGVPGICFFYYLVLSTSWCSSRPPPPGCACPYERNSRARCSASGISLVTTTRNPGASASPSTTGRTRRPGR